MSSANYPLEQLADIKRRRLEEAEKVLQAKKQILATEEAKQQELEKKRDEVKRHYQDKLTQLRAKLDEGTSSLKITQMKQYLKIVSENLAVEEMKVKAQVQVVEKAAVAVEAAKQDLFKKQKDVEKLKLHQKEWTQAAIQEEIRIETVEEDEMGSALYYLKKQSDKTYE
ncbi:MAG: type III secretion T3S chaperone [Candidatus Rhabdochlamydia sp.]